MSPSVIKYPDVTNVESGFSHVGPGMYTVKVDEVSSRESKNNESMVEVKFVPTKNADGKKAFKDKDGKVFKGTPSGIFFYAPLDADSSWAWQLKQLVTAFGLKVKGGNLSAIAGKECLARLKEDTDQNGDYRPRIAKLLPKGTDEEPEEEEEVDEPEEEDEEDEEPEEEEVDLDELDRAGLKALIKENELEIKVLKKHSDDDIRDLIKEQMGGEEEEEEEADDEEEEGGDNYEDLSLADLKQECEDRELSSKGSKPVLIKRLRKDDSEDPV